MSLPSYSDVFSITHERTHDEEIRAGDLVRTGENFHPHFTVIAVSGDKAWVRNVQNGVDSLAQLDRCRRIAPVDAALGVAVAAE
jgi:hypothetical protein